jgi:hypothetical protein
MAERYIVVNTMNKDTFLFIQILPLNGQIIWNQNLAVAKIFYTYDSANEAATKARVAAGMHRNDGLMPRYEKMIFADLHPRDRYAN